MNGRTPPRAMSKVIVLDTLHPPFEDPPVVFQGLPSLFSPAYGIGQAQLRHSTARLGTGLGEQGIDFRGTDLDTVMLGGGAGVEESIGHPWHSRWVSV